mgnify:FL=1
MWGYPGQWVLYFNGDRLVDLTVVGKPPPLQERVGEMSANCAPRRTVPARLWQAKPVL